MGKLDKPIYFHRNFKKKYQKRFIKSKILIEKVDTRIKLFVQDRENTCLKDHSLKGKLAHYRSFSITGDLRIIYKEEKDKIIFLDIGSHNQIYG